MLEKFVITKSQVLHESDVLIFLCNTPVKIAKKRNDPSETSPTILSHFNHCFLFGSSLLEFLQKRKQIAYLVLKLMFELEAESVQFQVFH